MNLTRAQAMANPIIRKVLEGQVAKTAKRSKYGNTRCEGLGRWWDSLKEREQAAEYLRQHLAGKFPAWLTSQGFHLTGDIWYEPDFVIIHDLSAVEVVDVKGGNATKTKVYRLKKKLLFANHGIQIVEK